MDRMSTRANEVSEGREAVYVFVYGTLKNGYGNNRLLQGETFIGEAVTIPHEYTMIDGGFPYVLLGGVFHIKGELWAVEHEDTILSLDALEGVRYDHYKRHITDVKLVKANGDVYSAIMYVASDNTQKMIESHKSTHMVPIDKTNVCEWQHPARRGSHR
jgi:gamma-glutamylcyclotransferase (GGCT)/AIG2-like uncharacterized protein YtfP